MPYFIVPMDEENKPRFDAYVEGVLLDINQNITVNCFISGEPANKKASNLYKIKSNIQKSKVGVIRDILVTMVHNMPIFIVSKNFKVYISKHYKNFAEFYPVEFNLVNNQPLKNYYICNLLKKYDCTDYENSILSFEFYDNNDIGYGGIYTIDSLILDETKIPKDAHIFLLDNIKKPVIVVSQSFKEEIENQKITGFKFVKPEDFMI